MSDDQTPTPPNNQAFIAKMVGTVCLTGIAITLIFTHLEAYLGGVAVLAYLLWVYCGED